MCSTGLFKQNCFRSHCSPIRPFAHSPPLLPPLMGIFFHFPLKITKKCFWTKKRSLMIGIAIQILSPLDVLFHIGPPNTMPHLVKIEYILEDKQCVLAINRSSHFRVFMLVSPQATRVLRVYKLYSTWVV